MDLQTFYDAARLYGRRWTLEIMTALRERPMRYTDLFQKITPAPHPKTFSGTLRRLRDQGLISRAGEGDGALYELTDAGHQLLPLVDHFAANLRRWSALHQEPGRQSPDRSFD